MPKMLAPGFRTRRSSSFIRFGAFAALVLFGLWTFTNRVPSPPVLPLERSEQPAADSSEPIPPPKAAQQPVRTTRLMASTTPC
jgi:hypothetical protein